MVSCHYTQIIRQYLNLDVNFEIETKIIPPLTRVLLKALITGGAGFIGQNISRLLKDDTIIFDTKPQGGTSPHIDYIKGDILDYESLEEACRGCDAVIHLAAKTGVAESIEQPDITSTVNIDGTANVLRSCVQNNIKKMILASSAAVYGMCDTLPVSESANLRPASPYGYSKLNAERQVSNFTKKFGICGISLRIFNVYGRGQKIERAGIIPKTICNIARGRHIAIHGDGTQTRDYISVKDVAAAFVLALQAKKPGTYNIASGRATSVNEIVSKIANMMQKKVTPIYHTWRNWETRYSKADITLAKTELKFNPAVRLDEGLAELVSVPDQICH